jgi:hypothetical protein
MLLQLRFASTNSNPESSSSPFSTLLDLSSSPASGSNAGLLDSQSCLETHRMSLLAERTKLALVFLRIGLVTQFFCGIER